MAEWMSTPKMASCGLEGRTVGYAQARIEGLEDPSQTAYLERHLRECAACARLYEELWELARLDAAGELWPRGEVPPPDLVALRRALAREQDAGNGAVAHG